MLLVCLVLGFGTFLAVVFGIVSSQSMSTTAEPSGTIGLLELVLRQRRSRPA